MKYKDIARRIIELKNADLEFRDLLIQKGQLGEGYNEGMAEIHNRNAESLEEIIRSIGYPAIDIVGKEASEAAWLIIQHSVGKPAFMRKCVKLLEVAVNEKKANPQNLAYLIDRIAVLEGRLQLYGTQFDWDEKGELSARPYDSLSEVNRRRRSVGLNSLEEQTAIIREQVKTEQQSPPADPGKRKQEIEQWRLKVGWGNKVF